MITILIADDHPIVRMGLREIVQDLTGFVVLEAGNSAEVLDIVAKNRINAVLLDISMPGRSGLETLQDLKREYPRLPVIMLTIYPEDQYAIRAIKAGADGYLTKNSAPKELVKAIHKVLSGEKYISAALAAQLLTEVRRESTKAPHEQLSDREYEVFRLLGTGMSLTDIAIKLSLSIKTVSTYRTRILEKMNLKSNADLIHYMYDHNLAE